MAVEIRDANDTFPVTDAEIITGGDTDTTYTIRPLYVEKHREIVKANTKQVPNRRTHQMDPQVDWNAVADDLIDYVLTGWVGIVQKGQPLPCERAFKLMLDAPRREALLDKAGYREVTKQREETKAESFRES